MTQSILDKRSKPKGAPGLPLGLLELFGLNLALNMVNVGATSALIRRGLFEPIQAIVQRLAIPVLVDLVALAVLGFLAERLTEVPGEPDPKATRFDRMVSAGAPWWLGYAFFVLLIRSLFVLSQMPVGSFLSGLIPTLRDLPSYRGITDLSAWTPTAWNISVLAVVVAGLVGGLILRRLRPSPGRTLWLLRGTVLLTLAISAPAAQRAHASWVPAVEGDELIGKLRPTARIEGGTWQPEGLRGRVTLVEFWTTWCGACKRLLPRLRELQKSQTDPRFQTLLVNVEGRGRPSRELISKIKAYQASRAPELPVLVDRGPWASAVGISVYPTVVLIGPRGDILRLWSGSPPSAALQKAVQGALSSFGDL